MSFPSPTPANVRKARLQAKSATGATVMSREEAAHVIGLPRPRWSEYESGTRPMRGTDWEMFLLLTDQHPDMLLMLR